MRRRSKNSWQSLNSAPARCLSCTWRGMKNALSGVGDGILLNHWLQNSFGSSSWILVSQFCPEAQCPSTLNLLTYSSPNGTHTAKSRPAVFALFFWPWRPRIEASAELAAERGDGFLKSRRPVPARETKVDEAYPRRPAKVRNKRRPAHLLE